MTKRTPTVQQKLLVSPSESPSEAPQATNTLPKEWIDETVGALFDPIIVYPGGGWEDDLPEKLKKDLPLCRLAHLMLCSQGKAHWDEACDLEALLYMYPRTMVAPLSDQWTRTYLYLGTKCLGDNVPENIRHETLSDYDMRELRDLKRWIYSKKVEARKNRGRQEKAERAQAEKVEAKPPPQLKMF